MYDEVHRGWLAGDDYERAGQLREHCDKASLAQRLAALITGSRPETIQPGEPR
jgi:hypothetical protein